MNPIKLSQQLQNTLVSYLTTTFDVNRDGEEPVLASFIRDSFSQPDSLFSGPHLELTLPYKTASTLQELVAEGTLSPKLLQMQCFQEGRPLPVDAPLYTHQARSLRKLCAEDRNIVVSSGTGSGKTECFLVPILNDILIDPTPGVRAVLVYPLNALVNDQLDRLRVLLRGTDITFGRYTGELDRKADKAHAQMQKEWREMAPSRQALFDQYPLSNEVIGRDQIQNEERLPQILITNYAMLEYLLLRPQDHPLFASGKWRYVVMDEAHTYAGAQGIEVGLLMRRLKLRLGQQPGEMRCVATSATLTDDDAEDACRFARALFGEAFEADDIIFGELDHGYVPVAASSSPAASTYMHPDFDRLIENVRQDEWESTDEMALLMHEIGLINDGDLPLAENCQPPRFLWEVLRGNDDLSRLRDYMVDAGRPVKVKTVAEDLFAEVLPSDDRETALYRLIELAAMARPAVGKPSLLPARYHLFVRPPQGVWACINPSCPENHDGNQWSKLFASPRERCDSCQNPVFPLVVCRTCGQVYIRLQKVGKEYCSETAVYDQTETHYVTRREIRENRALATDEDEEDDEGILVDQAGESILTQDELVLCTACSQLVRSNGKCGCEEPSDATVMLHVMKRIHPVKRKGVEGTRKETVNELRECGRCHSVALRGTEIATEITVNALTPLAVLTEDLYRSLPVSAVPDVKVKAGGGRKLLSFYDSRQGAARFAAFVQDVVNRQAYRRIIAEAAVKGPAVGHMPDLERMGEICLELALQYRVVHNDPEISKGDLPRDGQYLNQSQRERIMRYLRKQIFAEITTQLRSRQALESLGLLSVQYFEPGRLPNFSILAEKLNLSASECRTLVEYLLDDLRRSKIVTLPEGVLRDDPIFGRNKFSPRIVRSNPNTYEVAWIGKTNRHRRRQLMRKVLRAKQLPHDEQSAIQALESVLDWLLEHSNVLDISRPQDGYQLRHDQLLFQSDAQWYRCDQCQRLNDRGDELPCPHAHCQGIYRPLSTDEHGENGFYYDNLSQKLIPLRVEEHTAQLAADKGRKYQNQFKAGDINMLSCSTTFEMGIDLGDLQAVVMSNIPPTVANYKQRAGRAGRRTSGTAFILAWAANRPHDQTYFKNPEAIIGGRVRVPSIEIQNPIIIQRHVNAVLLSEFLRYCASLREFEGRVAAFYDEQYVNGAYFAELTDWICSNENSLLGIIDAYSRSVDGSIDPSQSLDSFRRDLREKGYGHYQTVAGYYRNELVALNQLQLELITQRSSPGEVESVANDMRRLSRLLDRLHSEDIINYLSDHGVLPSYSFPLHVVELRIPPHLPSASELRLQRNLQVAIREYAPGQEVVADKRIWKSNGLDFFGKEPQVFAYRICPNCNHLRLEDTPGKEIAHPTKPCPVCNEPVQRRSRTKDQYVQPDGFRVSGDSGKAAGQYVERPYNLMRSALVPGPVETKQMSQMLSVGYDRSGALLYVNEGVFGAGFRICPKCGRSLPSNVRSCNGKYQGKPCTGKVERDGALNLGFKRETDTLHLKFRSIPHCGLPGPDNISFWTSLKYALLQGASRALQVERRDIDGVLVPEPFEQTWRQSIVLYDNVPGGAGHVKRIGNELRQVVVAAIEIVDCDCERSCYRCLREYTNQWEHHLLDRESVRTYLRSLDADLQKSLQDEIPGLYPVVAANQAAWLWEHVERAQQEVTLSVDEVTLDSPTMDGTTWLDLLQELLLRGVQVRLITNQLSGQSSGSGRDVAILTHLRLLCEKGLELLQTNRKMPWIAVIDPEGTNPLAVRADEDVLVVLDFNVAEQLSAVTLSMPVLEAKSKLATYLTRTVECSQLIEPSNIKIREVEPDGKEHAEEEYFSDFYANPITSMLINDRYLKNRDQVFNRLGAHIELARQGGALERVVVRTKRWEDSQRRAVTDLERRFPDVNIRFRYDRNPDHDRYIEVMRQDGAKSRAIIGVGLDFIQPNGHVRKTFLVFETERD